MVLKNAFGLLIIGIFLSLQTFAQYEEEKVREAERWADSVYQSLSLTERIGQLIFIRANYSGENYLQEVPDLIKKYNLGGVTFFAGNPLDQVLQTNIYNQLPRVPLFISIDAEWGLGMRLSNTVSYPLQMTLGAVRNENLIYEMGRQIAQQCRRMGIHINFAPVVDVNNNPENPVIGMRAFGDMPGDVARKGALYMKGLQDGNVLASAKHFPGHGDTRVDSHKDLPVLKKSKRDLRELEFKPFKYLIDEGVASVMVAHLSVPSFDRRKYRPASLSENLIGKQLKKRMGFGGLVISDGLDMKGVTKYFRPGEIALEAFTAGNDILLIPEDIPASVSAIQQAIASGKVEEERLEESCRKILKYKYLVGAHQRKTIDTAHLPADLNKRAYFRLREQLFDSAITLVKNDRNLVPLSYPDTIKPALVIIGEENPQPFAEAFRQFMPVAVHYLRHDADINARQQLFSEIEEANMLIVALVNTNISAARNYGITDGDIQFVEFLARQKPVILDVFASPYVLDFFSDAGIFHAILVSYQDKPGIQRKSAGIILGMDASSGKLPVSAGGFTTGTGWSTPKTRLSYANPEDLGIDTAYLGKVDSIARNAIDMKAFPGCQILAAKDGYIFYDKCFGYHTYKKETPVSSDDVYDLASLTKILATTPSLMAMVDQARILLDARLSDYLLYLRGTNKEDLGFREVLTHQAGLRPWIPYYENTLINERWDTLVYRPVITEEFPVRVAKNMYIREHYRFKIYQDIVNSELGEKSLAYSDLGFYLFQDMMVHLTNLPFDQFVYDFFYTPLGLNHLRFKPLKYFPVKNIIPTEFDRKFRQQVLVGDVHDQGAAMLGGVAGHAGLFGNSRDVAVMMQMFLNKGTYGGRVFFSPHVVTEFTRCQFPEQDNRRGLGFDKPLLEYEDHRSNCRDASPSSFGHSGFTGTYTWADPETGLIYVFLSNRIHPDMDNRLIMEHDVRTNIHQLFYEAIKQR